MSEEGVGEWGGITDSNSCLKWEEMTVDGWEVGLGEGFGNEASEGVRDGNGSDSLLLFWDSNQDC